jgi:hypothetical protein
MTDKNMLQYIVLPGAALLCGAMSLCGCVVPRAVSDNQPTKYVVFVDANRPWQNSGVSVRQGDVLHCLAEGRWSDNFGEYDPGGDPTRMQDNFGVNAPANSLLLRISGQTNRVYAVGKQANIRAERSGHVFLRGNAALFPGARGRLKVTLMPAPDTDGDGLSDYEEIFLWRTNPHRRDSNGAGFGDEALVEDLRNRFGGGVLQPALQ